jgi:hypothetical protein
VRYLPFRKCSRTAGLNSTTHNREGLASTIPYSLSLVITQPGAMLPGGIVNNHPVRSRALMPSLRGCRPYDGRPPRSHELAEPLRGHSSGRDPSTGSAVTAPEPPGSQPRGRLAYRRVRDGTSSVFRRTHPAVALARRRCRSGVSVRDEVGRPEAVRATHRVPPSGSGSPSMRCGSRSIRDSAGPRLPFRIGPRPAGRSRTTGVVRRRAGPGAMRS